LIDFTQFGRPRGRPKYFVRSVAGGETYQYQ